MRARQSRWRKGQLAGGLSARLTEHGLCSGRMCISFDGGLSDEEKCVLCCFLNQGLNDIACKEEHQLHDAILNALFDDEALHKAELDYWTDTDDPDETNWWPITKGFLRVRKSRETTRE